MLATIHHNRLTSQGLLELLYVVYVYDYDFSVHLTIGLWKQADKLTTTSQLVLKHISH